MTCDAYREKELTASDIFECRRCGECCRGFGGTLLSENDVRAIADFLGSSFDHFLRSYCVRSGSGLVLAQGEDGYCIFADHALCGIHPVKPRMCRAWPFIEGVMRDPGNWQIMAGTCPGMRADICEETILRCVKAEMARSA